MNKELTKLSDFSNAKVGDKVYSISHGNGTIHSIHNIAYPITVIFSHGQETFTLNGEIHIDDVNPILFRGHDTVTIIPNARIIKDKSLVWCWNNNASYIRLLKFYDGKNHCTFTDVDGKRNGNRYANIEPYKGEYTQWAIDAQATLED